MPFPFLAFFNRFLPFATPGTPLVQDLLHFGALAALLYFAPQIQELLGRWRSERSPPPPPPNPASALPQQQQQPQPHLPRDERERVELPFVAHEEPNFAPAHLDDAEEDVEEEEEGADEGGNRGGAAQQRGEAGGSAAQRSVGAKKAKSLARRDQRRAYHEFQRVQGEAQRAREAEGKEEREAKQAAERERRRGVEKEMEAKKAVERERKRERERREQEGERERREVAIALVRRELGARKRCNLVQVAGAVGGDGDEVWVEKMLNASGMLGRNADGSLTMVTSTGWVVRVTRDDMLELYQRAAASCEGNGTGEVGYDAVATLLADLLKEEK